MRSKRSVQRALIVCLLVVALTLSASALTINRVFIPNGSPFPISGGNATGPPGTVAGGGNIQAIFNAAADWWELAILDSFNVTINFGWAPLAGTTIGQATTIVARPPLGSDIRFDSDGSTNWFLDPTPHDNSEYTTFSEPSADLGGGVINTGRVYTGATGAALGRFDLLSVAKHEIGHALGFAAFDGFPASPPWADPIVTTVGGGRPNPGTTVQTTLNGGGHFDPVFHPDTLLEPFSSINERKLPSAIDILVTAELSGWSNLNLDPEATVVPEPGTIFLTGTALLGLGLLRRRLS